jgi:hypothetical protein
MSVRRKVTIPDRRAGMTVPLEHTNVALRLDPEDPLPAAA